jgi:peroxiredoxin
MTDTKHTSSLPLEKGQIIPAFSLPATDGMPHGPWDYKQREHLIVIVIHSATMDAERALLHTFATQYTDFRAEYCAILTITADAVITNLQAQEHLRLPFPLLADPTGRIIQHYTDWDATTRTVKPGIILADRYNALYAQWHAAAEADLPSIKELLEHLQYMNTLCAL